LLPASTANGSKWILAVIKERGLRVMIRLFGIILTAIAIQFIVTGVLHLIQTHLPTIPVRF
jgi:small neutral amino acid transporter SnatA (MarC family)